MADGVRLGVDIGGTLTDFTLVQAASGPLQAEKASTGATEGDVLEDMDRFREQKLGALAVRPG